MAYVAIINGQSKPNLYGSKQACSASYADWEAAEAHYGARIYSFSYPWVKPRQPYGSAWICASKIVGTSLSGLNWGCVDRRRGWGSGQMAKYRLHPFPGPAHQWGCATSALVPFRSAPSPKPSRWLNLASTGPAYLPVPIALLGSMYCTDANHKCRPSVQLRLHPKSPKTKMQRTGDSQ